MKTVGSVRTSVPPHLQDAHYKGSAKLGHGQGYQYAHDYLNHYVEQQYLPDEDLRKPFPFHLGTNGYEQKIRENFKNWKDDRIKGEEIMTDWLESRIIRWTPPSEKRRSGKKCTSSRSTAG